MEHQSHSKGKSRSVQSSLPNQAAVSIRSTQTPSEQIPGIQAENAAKFLNPDGEPLANLAWAIVRGPEPAQLRRLGFAPSVARLPGSQGPDRNAGKTQLSQIAEPIGD